MSEKIVKLPTDASSYVTVRRTGGLWAAVFLTPQPPLPLRGQRKLETVLATAADWRTAAQYAEDAARRMKRPLRLPRLRNVTPREEGEA